MSLHESATSGDRLKTLQTLRDHLASAIDDCDSLRDLAALSGRLQSVLEEIAELAPPEQKGDAVDEIAQRRNARRSAAPGKPRAKRSG
ncbi:hypothetical protein AB0J20_16340 [Micromonospora costi]|uniref:hypothetical protein n=1 Tax=Micromonospora costi TaxID=1530042 RepID=UPI0033FE9985